MFEEDLDEAKFVKEFTSATIKGWKGLKLKYLEDLMLVDLQGQDINKEMTYSQDNAEVLVENSNEFDNWLNEVVFDLKTFMWAKEVIFQKLKVLLDNQDVGMTKTQYLEMCEQLGEEPDWDKCPASGKIFHQE